MSILENSLAPQTRFDWNFQLGDIPVRVHPYFWLTTALLGLSTEGKSFGKIVLDLLVWVAIVFVSVLVHEMGHILMGRFFGSRGHIILTGFCGLAVGSSELPERWQRNAVSLAGPAAGFLLAAVAAGICWLINPDLPLALLGALIRVPLGPEVVLPSEIVTFALLNILWINILWGLVNLLPIWPLDGGQISREICEAYRGREGVRLSLLISLFTAAALAILALIEMVAKKPLVPYLAFGGSLFPVLFFGLLAFSSWQFLQFQRRGGFDWEDQEDAPRAPWEQDADWWKRGDNPWRD